MTAALLIASHCRLVTDPRRGRLLLQAAYVAMTDADALWDQHAWPPVPFASLSDETRAEIDRLRAMSNELAADAARLGVRGGIDAAFGPVFAAAVERMAATDEREHLAWEVARALEAGATLMAPRCSVGPLGEATGHRPAFACYVDPGGVMINDGRFTADAAAAAFCGERGAGEDAARAALETWESGEERAA